MTSHDRRLIAALAALLAGAAEAREWQVVIGDLPPMRVEDAEAYSNILDPAGDDEGETYVDDNTGDARVVPSGVVVRKGAIPAVPARAVAEGADTPASLGHLKGVPAGPPPADLAGRLARYRIADPKDVVGVWSFLARDHTPFEEDVKLDNSVIRWVLASRRAPAGSPASAPDRMDPAATRGVVKLPGGVAVRSRPWGPMSGTVFPEGAVVELVPLAQGAWFRRAGEASGWVPGVWLETK